MPYVVNRSIALAVVLSIGVVITGSWHFYAWVQAEHGSAATRWWHYLLFVAPHLAAFTSLLLMPSSRYVKVVAALMVCGVAYSMLAWFQATGPEAKGWINFSAFLISWLFGLVLVPTALVAISLRLDANFAGPLDTSVEAANPTVEPDARDSSARGSP